MKRIALIFAALSFLLALNAQKPSLTKAYNHFYDKEYDKAKTQIDLCAQDEKLSAKALTWLYKGNIDFLLANQEYSEKQKNENYQIKYPNAPVEAFDAFEKALSINPKVEALDMMNANDAIKQLYPYLLVRGVDQLIEKDYKGAKSTLEKGIRSYEADKPQYPMNGDLYYYYALALENLGDNKGMMDNLKKALDDGSKNPYVFGKLIDYYKTNNDKENAAETLRKAKESAPSDKSVKLLEIDYAFWCGDTAKASSLLNSIDVNSLNSVDEMVNVANFFIKEKRYEDADAMLRRAKSKDPDNFVVLYNLGVCNLSFHEQYFELQNKLALQQADKSSVEDAKSRSEMYLQNAAEFFEQANKLQPDDLNLLKTLQSIYVRQQNKEKEELVKKLIDSIER